MLLGSSHLAPFPEELWQRCGGNLPTELENKQNTDLHQRWKCLWSLLCINTPLLLLIQLIYQVWYLKKATRYLNTQQEWNVMADLHQSLIGDKYKWTHSISVYVNGCFTFSYKNGLFSNIFRTKSQLKTKLHRILNQLGIGTRKVWATRGF